MKRLNKAMLFLVLLGSVWGLQDRNPPVQAAQIGLLPLAYYEYIYFRDQALWHRQLERFEPDYFTTLDPGMQTAIEIVVGAKVHVDRQMGESAPSIDQILATFRGAPPRTGVDYNQTYTGRDGRVYTVGMIAATTLQTLAASDEIISMQIDGQTIRGRVYDVFSQWIEGRVQIVQTRFEALQTLGIDPAQYPELLDIEPERLKAYQKLVQEQGLEQRLSPELLYLLLAALQEYEAAKDSRTGRGWASLSSRIQAKLDLILNELTPQIQSRKNRSAVQVLKICLFAELARQLLAQAELEVPGCLSLIEVLTRFPSLRPVLQQAGEGLIGQIQSEEEIAELLAALDRAQKDLDRLRLQVQKLPSLSEQLQEMERQLGLLQGRVRRLEGERDRLKEELAAAEEKNDRQEDQIAVLKRENEQLRVEIERLRSEDQEVLPWVLVGVLALLAGVLAVVLWSQKTQSA